MLAVGVVFALPSLIDWNDYKDEMTAWSERTLGRRIEIAGEVRVALLPTPALMAEDVRLANVDGATDSDMATLDRVEVRVAFMPLLAGLVQVETIRLVKPVLHVERFADGKTNLEFLARPERAAKPAADATAGSGGGGDRRASARDTEPTVKLDNFSVVDGLVVYRDAKIGRTERVEQIHASFAADSLSGPFESFGEFVYRGSPLSYRLGVGRVVQERTVPFDLSVDLLPGLGKAEVSGAITKLDEEPKFKGDIAVSGESLADLVAAFMGTGDLPDLADQPFSLAAVATLDAHSADAKDVEMTLGGLKAGGAMSVDFADAVSVSGVFSAPHIDLDSLLAFTPKPRDPAKTEMPKTTGGGVPLPRKQKAEKAEAAPSTAGFALPEGVSVALQLAADKITFRKSSISDTRINLDLAGGEVVISQVDALLPGGSNVFASGFLTAPEGVPSLDLSVETKIADLHRIFRWLGIPVPDVPAGRLRKADFNGEIHATPKQVEIRKVALDFDSTHMTGGVTVALGRGRAAFGADFRLDRLNVDAYLDSREQAARKAGGGAGSAPSGGATTESKAAPAVDPQGSPLVGGLSILRSFDANLRLAVKELTVGRNQVRDARLDAMIYQGRLELRDLSVGDFAGTEAVIKGAIDSQGTVPAFDGLEVDATVGDVARLSRAFGVELGARGKDAIPLKLSGRVQGSVIKPRVNLSVRGLGGTVEAVGFAYPLPGDTWFQGDVKTAFPSLVSLFSRLGVDYRPTGDIGGFDVAAGVVAGPALVSFSEMKGSIGGTTVSGNLSWNTAAERPRLVADLNTGAVTVDRYLPRSRSAALRRKAPGGPIRAAWVVPEGADPWVGLVRTIALAEGIDTERWSTDIVNLDVLRAFDAVVNLHSKALSYKAYKLDNAAIEAALDHGRADLASIKGTLFGGGFDGSATLDVPGRTLAAKTAIADLDLALAGKAFGGGAVSGGRFDLNAEMTASGKSVAEWISSLAGKGGMAARGIRAGAGNRADELAVIAWIPAIFDQLRSAFGVQSGATDGSGSFAVANGRIACPDLAVVSDVGKATAKGTVDLPRWRLDFEGDVTPAGNIVSSLLSGTTGIELTVPLKVSGSLDDPKTVLDLKRLPGNVLRLPGTLLKNLLNR